MEVVCCLLRGSCLTLTWRGGDGQLHSGGVVRLATPLSFSTVEIKL